MLPTPEARSQLASISAPAGIIAGTGLGIAVFVLVIQIGAFRAARRLSRSIADEKLSDSLMTAESRLMTSHAVKQRESNAEFPQSEHRNRF